MNGTARLSWNCRSAQEIAHRQSTSSSRTIWNVSDIPLLVNVYMLEAAQGSSSYKVSEGPLAGYQSRVLKG